MRLWVSYLVVWLLINLVHTVAHLLAARLFRVSLDRVSLGVGPTLWSRRRGRTQFRIALFPVAFLVRLRTRWKKSEEGVWPPSHPQDIRNKKLFVRAMVFGAAPAALILLAFVSAFIVAGHERTEMDLRPIVGAVEAGMPAGRAGIKDGDLILAVNGKRPETWFDIRKLLSLAGEGTVHLKVQRDRKVLPIDVRPERSIVDDMPVIGITAGKITIRPPGLPAQAKEAGATIAEYFKEFFQNLRPAPARVRTLEGPIAISVFKEDREDTLLTFWQTATFFSLLCFTWCIVFPYLDGRRFLFILVEALARRPVHPKHEQRFNRIWFVIVVLINVADVVVRLIQYAP